MKILVIIVLAVALIAAVGLGIASLAHPQEPALTRVDNLRPTAVPTPVLPLTAPSSTPTFEPGNAATDSEVSEQDLLALLRENQTGVGNGTPVIASDFRAADTALNQGDAAPLVHGKVQIDVGQLKKDNVHFYHTALPDGSTVYYFIVRDSRGIYRAAANACQVCFATKRGFHREGNFMVCNTCGNRYPLEKIATEKGGCNPIPINPHLPVKNDQIIIQLAELQDLAGAF